MDLAGMSHKLLYMTPKGMAKVWRRLSAACGCVWRLWAFSMLSAMSAVMVRYTGK